MITKNFTLIYLLFGLTFSAFAQYEAPIKIYDLISDTIMLEKNMSISDIDNDGYKDVFFSTSNIYTSNRYKDLSLKRGDGYSNFEALETVLDISYFNITDYLLRDINSDGIDDVIFKYQLPVQPFDIGIAWYAGNGDGSFSSVINDVGIGSSGFGQVFTLDEVEDFDNDGHLDLLIYANNGNQSIASVVFNDGFGNFNTSKIIADDILFYGTIELDVADLNGDQKLDVVISVDVSSAALITIENAGNRNFDTPKVKFIQGPNNYSLSYSNVEIADLDGDGTDEVFFSTLFEEFCLPHCSGNPEYKYRIYSYNNASNQLVAVNQINSWPHSLSIYSEFRETYGDVNHDGNIDILTYVDSIKWLIGDGNGNFPSTMPVSAEQNLVYGEYISMKIADMDNDGDLDIFVLNAGSSNYKNCWYIENTEFQPDHDEDGFVVDEDCDDKNDQIGDVLTIEGLLPTYEICEGKAFQFLINNASEALNYQWNGPAGYNETVPEPIIENITLADAGNYTIQSSNLNCTSALLTTELIVGAYPEVTISENGNVLTAESNDATSYQWYLNENLISGATNQVYTAAESGDYTVVVASDLGCETTSTIVTVVISGIYNQHNDIFEMYPNPVNANGILHLQISNEATFPSVIRVLNSKGQTVLQEEVKSLEHNLSLEGLSSGVFSLQILNKNEIATQKFIVVN